MDRELHLSMLKKLAEFYPGRVQLNSFLTDFDGRNVEGDLHYLYEHGLVDMHVTEPDGGGYFYGHPRINHRGMDFLADDGGLAAILGVVTVKLHDQTIRALLEEKVQDSPDDPSLKAAAIKAIREAPIGAIKQVSEYAIQRGLENLPSITPLLQMLSDR